MNRRYWLLTAVAALARGSEGATSLRGPLRQDPEPVIESSGKRVVLSGDEATMLVLRDSRLSGTDFEVLGAWHGPAAFDVEKIHKKALFVHRGGKRLYVTYWCDVCYIRTFSPGKCWCCQKETDLDLRESLDN